MILIYEILAGIFPDEVDQGVDYLWGLILYIQ